MIIKGVTLRQRNYLHIAIWIVFFQGVGALLGLITKNNIPLWYNSLIKSNLTPPSIIFSVVWPLLYALLAVLGWSLWKKQNNTPNQESKTIWYLFLTQMIINWLWTPIFFQYHLIGFSLGCLLLLIGLNLYIAWMLMNKNLILGLFFTPYILWLFFAAYLNAVIYWWN